MYDYLRWMTGHEVSVVLRQTTAPDTILEGTLTRVDESAIVIRNEDADEWVVALDCVAFVKVHGAVDAESA